MTLRSFTLTRPSDWLRPKKKKKKEKRKKEADPVQPCLLFNTVKTENMFFGFGELKSWSVVVYP